MATRRGPRFKECRRFGINVCGHPKALDRLGTTVKRNKKMSEYGKQLLEKQKIKAYYGIFERQLLRYYKAASKSKERTADALFCTLECRLDNLVYDVISLKASSRSNELFKSNFLERASFALPYISKDKESFSGTLVRLPLREEIPIQIEDQLVVEYFSR